jgi:hypothetical protein
MLRWLAVLAAIATITMLQSSTLIAVAGPLTKECCGL